jgi:hypothetical protein
MMSGGGGVQPPDPSGLFNLQKTISVQAGPKK